MTGVFDSLPADGSPVAGETVFEQCDTDPATAAALLGAYVAFGHVATDDEGLTFRRLTLIQPREDSNR